MATQKPLILSSGSAREIVSGDKLGGVTGGGASGEVLTYDQIGSVVAATGVIPSAITVANEASDASCFLLFATAATGDLGPKTNTGLLFNSSSGLLTAPSLSCPTFFSSGAIGFIPASGSGVNITLATTGDFNVNSGMFFVDTSSTKVGVGTSVPNYGQLEILNNTGTAVELLTLHSTFNNPSGAKSITWRDSAHSIIGQIDVSYTSPYASMSFGSLYASGYQTTPTMTLQGTNVGIGITSPAALCHLAASTTSRASLCMDHGSAPTSPINGDMWTTTAGLFVRINGVTKTVTLT